MITSTQLQQVMPHLPADKLALYLPHLNQAMQTCAVDTALRTAAFVAQLAHESGEFRWMEEIWGPTAAQLRYEPPGTLAAALGNTQAGDGKLFKGRGPIQITGRANYQKFGGLLGVDLIANPPLAATPAVAFATAGAFWQKNGLNELADAQQFVTITKRINGGTNGLADRQTHYERAKSVLLAVTPAAAPPAAPPAVPATTRGMPAEPLTRGFEAIRAAAAKPAAKIATKVGAKPAKRPATKPATTSAKKAPKGAPASRTPG